jgi:hypothetical protein
MTIEDLTEGQIHVADADQLNRWIAEERGDSRYDGANSTQWTWSPPGALGPEHCHNEKPRPYASEWWAAGPLLEEVQSANDCDSGLALNSGIWGTDKWGCGPLNQYYEGHIEYMAMGDTAPETIARTWLLAYHRGLLEDV